jgi:plasmid stabilization system protein ParE
MSLYVLSNGAERDLDSIWEYIARDSVDAADRWIGTLYQAFDSLAASPGMGHRRQDLTSLPVVFWPVGRYLILYRVRGTLIEIVAVTQGSRDIPSFLFRLNE